MNARAFLIPVLLVGLPAQTAAQSEWTEEELTGLRGPRREKGALISIPSNPDTLRYQWNEIDRIEVMTGYHTGEGLALGGLIGIGLAALAFHGTNEGFAFPTPFLYLTIAIFPATVGAIIGSGIPKWDPIF